MDEAQVKEYIFTIRFRFFSTNTILILVTVMNPVRKYDIIVDYALLITVTGSDITLLESGASFHR